MADVATLAPAGDATATDQTDRSRRWTHPGWGAGAFLLGGLALVAVWVSKAPGVDVHTLDLLHADGVQTHDIMGTYPGSWSDPAHNPFTANRLRLITPLLALVYLTSVTAIGATFLSTVRGTERWPAMVRLLAGFLPGFLMVLLPLQLLFQIVPTFTASWVALVAVPLVAIYLQHGTIAESAARLRRNEGYARISFLGVLAWIVLFLLVSALWRIQAGRYFMTPDSIGQFLQAADAQMAGAVGKHLALWDQQSDEWVFNAPLLFTSRTGHDQLFTFWAAQFVALTSFVSLVFGLASTFAWRRRTLAGLLAVGMIMASTPSIFPWDNIVIIGGQNPALWLAHPGRQISIVAPFIVLLLVTRPSRRGVIAILLVAAGLAFTTVEGTLYAGVAVAGLGVWRFLRGRGWERLRAPRARRAGPVVVNALAVLALIAPLYVYYAIHHTDWPDSLGWLLVLGAVAAVLAAVLLALGTAPPSAPSGAAEVAPDTSRPRWKSPAGLAAAALVALVVGQFLSNNLVGDFAGGSIRHALGSIFPGFDGAPLSRNVLQADNLTFPLFSGIECPVSGHCASFGYFLAAYGFTLVVAFAGWLALGRVTDDERVNGYRAAWLVTVAGLAIGLAVLDFTGAQDFMTAWILTRLVEVPYYAILAFAAVVFASSRSRVTLYAGAGVLAAWSIIPFAGDHVVQQVYKNADWLMGTLH
jgi:hypothetical protein